MSCAVVLLVAAGCVGASFEADIASYVERHRARLDNLSATAPPPKPMPSSHWRIHEPPERGRHLESADTFEQLGALLEAQREATRTPPTPPLPPNPPKPPTVLLRPRLRLSQVRHHPHPLRHQGIRRHRPPRGRCRVRRHRPPRHHLPTLRSRPPRRQGHRRRLRRRPLFGL